jgi:PmbA protein
MRGEAFYRNLFRLMNEHFIGLKFLAVVWEQDQALTRFANSRIHQNVAERKASLSVLATKDNKIALATSNDLTVPGLKALRERLETMLRFATPLDYEFRLPEVSMNLSRRFSQNKWQSSLIECSRLRRTTCCFSVM